MRDRSKVHLFFGGGLVLVLAMSVAINLLSGLTLASAVLEALGQIRPVEYGMYFVFWYWLARGQPTTFSTTFTSLNLRGSKS
jgi:hypothetical protein